MAGYCGYRDSDAGGEDEEDEGETEEDLESVDGGPVVPGLGVDSDLTEDVGGWGQTVLDRVVQLAAILSLVPGEKEALGVGGEVSLELREEVRVRDVLADTEPGPVALGQAHAGAQDGLGGWESSQGQLA